MGKLFLRVGLLPPKTEPCGHCGQCFFELGQFLLEKDGDAECLGERPERGGDPGLGHVDSFGAHSHGFHGGDENLPGKDSGVSVRAFAYLESRDDAGAIFDDHCEFWEPRSFAFRDGVGAEDCVHFQHESDLAR